VAEHIEKLISSYIKKLSTNDRKKLREFITELLDTKTQKHIKLTKIYGKKLIFHADSSVWCYQFNLKKEGLLKKIKKEFPHIEGIRVKVGR